MVFCCYCYIRTCLRQEGNTVLCSIAGGGKRKTNIEYRRSTSSTAFSSARGAADGKCNDDHTSKDSDRTGQQQLVGDTRNDL